MGGESLVSERAMENYPNIQTFSGDAGYRGTGVEFVHQKLNLTLHMVEKLQETFAVLPKRWVVERIFG